jgi:ribosomal protein S18 acetylase RimI-like enzyme
VTEGPTKAETRRSPRVREATAEDVTAIARIRIDSWRATYAGIVPAPILERMDLARNEAWIAGRIAEPGDRTTLVVENMAGDVRGYALAAPCVDEDAAGLGEIEAIYLAPEARGSGLGLPLLEAAAEALRAGGFGAAVLWVLTDNLGARRFYERSGFQRDGAARTLDFDGTPIEEIRYRRALSA